MPPTDRKFIAFRANLFADASLLSYGMNERGERVCFGVSIDKLNARLDAEATRHMMAMPATVKKFLDHCLHDILAQNPSLVAAARDAFIEQATYAVSVVDADKQWLKVITRLLADGWIAELDIESDDAATTADFCWTDIGAEALWLTHARQV